MESNPSPQHPKNWLQRLQGKRMHSTDSNYTADEKSWDELLIGTGTYPHYMQSSVWAETKSRVQWPISRIVIADTTPLPLQVFSRSVPGLGRLHYAPEVTGVTQANVAKMTKQVKSQYNKGLAFKLELYQPNSDELLAAFKQHGWVKANSVQPRTTVIVDLHGTIDELYANLKKRARYEARVGERSGVKVEKVAVTKDNLDKLATLMDVTSARTGAFFRNREYSNKYWLNFANNRQGDLYFARHDKDLLAAAYVIKYGKNAWYKDGGSVREKSNMFAPRYLLWEIMRDLHTQGFEHFDLSGIPAPHEVETSPLKGLFTFKTGFTNDIAQLMPALELPLSQRYKLWPKVEYKFLRLYSGFRHDFWY